MTRKKRERTEKSRFKHKSTGEYCTCAAYIAEMMCLRKAEHENHGSLAYKFWNKKPWDWTFKKQLFIANNLLKRFPEKAVIRALNGPELRKIFSLNHPKVIPILEKYTHSLKVEQSTTKSKQVDPPQQTLAPNRRTSSFGRKSILSKLKDIENNGEEEG